MTKQVLPGETEKITLNLGNVDLGRIDLLVEEGFDANCTVFIRSAIRARLTVHQRDIGAVMERRTLDSGLQDVSRADLKAVRDVGETLHIKAVGVARIVRDVSVEPAVAAIASTVITRSLQALPEIKSTHADRMF